MGKHVHKDEIFGHSERITSDLIRKLGPGDYVFKVRVIEENGITSSDCVFLKDNKVLPYIIAVRIEATVDDVPVIEIVEILSDEKN